MSELEAAQSENIAELEMERALLDSEQQDELLLLQQCQRRIADLKHRQVTTNYLISW